MRFLVIGWVVAQLSIGTEVQLFGYALGDDFTPLRHIAFGIPGTPRRVGLGLSVKIDDFLFPHGHSNNECLSLEL